MSFTNMDKGRPGVWVNFEEEAVRAVEGSDGVVVIVKENYNVTADDDTIYEFNNQAEAQAVVGITKMADITRAFEGGAGKVIVYTKPTADDYVKAQAALELQFFEALSFDHPLEAADVLSWKAWLSGQAENENYRVMAYGSADDSVFATSVARSVTDNNELVTNVINAPVFGDTEYTSADFAPWVAGAFASTPLESSITYKEVPGATDVNVRLTSAQIKEALAKGAIVFEYTGRKVRLVRGVATGGQSLKRVAIKQATARDFKFLLEEKYIGDVGNGPNERLNARGELKDYLQVFEDRGIIEPGNWYVNVLPGPEKRQVVVKAFMVDLETMEEIYITVGLGA